MPFSVTPTPYGRPASDLLAAQVRVLKDGDPLSPVTVVVPATYAGIAARRRLASDGVAAVTFLTVQRLAERFAGSVLAGEGRRPASPALVSAAVRRVLAERPGVFRPVAGHPATEEALAGAHAELRGVSDGALDALAARGRRTADVVAIHRAVRALLRPAWHDEHDLIAAAADAVRAGGALADGGALILHLPQRVDPATATLLVALADRTEVTVNVGLTGDAAADSGVRAALTRAGIAVPAGGWPAPCAHAIVTASDADEEVRVAVRAIIDAARSGVPFAGMAVVWGAAEPYARTLEAQFEAAGIPRNGTPVRTVAESVAGRTVLGLLDLPESGFRRDAVMALVAGAPVVGRGGDLVPTRAWERASRDAGVVDGDDWDTRLAAYAVRLEGRADVAEAEEREASAAGLRADARRARELRRFVGELRATLAGLAAAVTWEDLSTRSLSLLGGVLGGPERRDPWPAEERRAMERVEISLAGLAGLDAIGGPPVTLAVFRRALVAELGASLRRAGRFGEGVLVGPPSVVTGLDLDRVIILGLAEGILPSARLEDSLVSDADRRATGGELRLLSDTLLEDRHRFLAAIAAGRHATLSFPRGDLRRPGERVASRWLLEVAGQLAGRPSVSTSDLGALDVVDEVPSFVGGIRRLAFPATGQEHNLRRLLDDGVASLSGDAIVAAGAALTRARASGEFTRFDGNLAGSGVPSPASAALTSATRLETWASCPFRYFAEAVLGITVPDTPERRLAMTPLDRGSLVHDVLDRFVRGIIEGAPADPERLARTADEVFAEYEARGVTGRSIFWRRDQRKIHRDLQRFLTLDRERGGVPLRTELRFGAADPVVFDIGGGQTMRFRGAADRVDEGDDGGLVVIDYKTGSARRYAGLDGGDPTAHGRRFQLPVYAVAARHAMGRPDAPVEAAYWFVTEDAHFEWIGYPVSDALLDSVAQTLSTVDRLIGAGVFPPLPTPDTYIAFIECPFCDPDGLGPGERRRDWERKRTAADLAPFLELIGDA